MVVSHDPMIGIQESFDAIVTDPPEQLSLGPGLNPLSKEDYKSVGEKEKQQSN